MAYYALLDENNIVVQVITGKDETELIEGMLPEHWYSLFTGKKCKRTSFNTRFNQHNNNGTPFRGNYAGIGYTYDEEFDVFYSPRPFPSWKLNYTTYEWKAPSPKPDEGTEEYYWKWSEINQEWIKIHY